MRHWLGGVWVLGCAPTTVTGVDTSPPEPVFDCEPGTRNGALEGNDDARTADGTRFTVRVPDSYDATVAHPLVVVYAPAGGDPEITESFTGLTAPLLNAGYLVAYADHRSPTSEAVLEDLGTIPRRVARQWCVDASRVHFTGHSDGGSVATVLAVRPDLATIAPASIAPSAAGTNGAYLAEQACPDPLAVMVLHSSRDGLFPGYGAEAAEYWRACLGCRPDRGDADNRGCEAYAGCDGADVTYCEHDGSHGTWPAINRAMVSFFDAAPPREAR